MTTILVVPDCHAKPGTNHDRFTWLGKYILDTKPDKVVNLGDMADMVSLCSAEKGKRSFEGARYKKDVQAAIDAQTKLFQPLKDYNLSRKRSKKTMYAPELYMTEGNHDHRIERETQLSPILDGTIGLGDLCFESFGWSVTKYKEALELDGIYFSHCFTKGLMDFSISGTTATLAPNVLKEMKDNAIQGHSHILSLSNSFLPNGRKIWAISAGCYFDYPVDYVSRKAQLDWWRGIILLHVEKQEITDMEIISMATLKREYH